MWKIIINLIAFSVFFLPLSAKTIVLGSLEKLDEQLVSEYILVDIYKQIDIDLKVLHMPPKRIMLSNLVGLIDGELARTKEYGSKQEQLVRIEPSYYSVSLATYCLKNTSIVINKKEDLKPYQVALIKDETLSQITTKDVQALSYASSPKALFSLLSNHKVDIVVVSKVNGEKLLKSKEFKNLKQCGVFAKYELFNYISKNKISIKDSIAKKIQELIKSGKLKEMVKKAEKKVALLK